MTHIVDTPLTGDKVTEDGVPVAQFQALLESLEIAINELEAPPYTVATLPAQKEGRIIYVSDETGGATTAFSDGTNWRRSQDRVIVS